MSKFLKPLEFPQLTFTVFPNSRITNAKRKITNVLNVYKKDISAAYNFSDIEIDEPTETNDGVHKDHCMTNRLHFMG